MSPGLMPEGRMCVRRVCERAGLPIEATRCPACDMKTAAFDDEASGRLVAGASRWAAHEGFRQEPATPVLIVTTNDVPGHVITDVYGDVFGLTVRSRNYFSQMGAKYKALVGGELAGQTKLLLASRDEARERLRAAARELGANAIVAMRFDCNEIETSWSEIAAYGTAVTIVKNGT